MSVHEVFPYLRASNAENAIAFYQSVFGAKEKFRMEETNGRIGHAELTLGDTTMMISDPFPELGIEALDPTGPCVSLFHLHVDDADAMVGAAVEAGATVVQELKDEFYGERSGMIRDPYGYDWKIGHSIEKVSLEEMQNRQKQQTAND